MDYRREGGVSWAVHKFGGSSLADASCFEQVLRVLDAHARDERDAGAGAGARALVVVSAVGGVTNKLERVIECAVQRDRNEHYLEGIEELREMHESLAEQLLPQPDARQPFVATLTSSLRDLKDLLRAVYIARSASEQMRELVMGYGELWSAQLFWALLRARQTKTTTTATAAAAGGSSSSAQNIGGGGATGAVAWLDARDVIIARRIPTMSKKAIEWSQSQRLFDEWMAQHSGAGVVVATGFVASDPDNMPTTLGRNGSDFSASIFARLVGASQCTIWTDVDGVYSADPRTVPEAVVIPKISFMEAAELAYFGARVLHPDSLAPVLEMGIPVRIRNTFRLESVGTEICAAAGSAPESGATDESARAVKKAATDTTAGVKGFTSVKDVTVVNVEGTGMIGVPGIAGRAFSALYEANVSVILIAQASSEYSICVAVPGRDGTHAQEALRRAFRIELADGIVSSVEQLPHCSILAMVGEKMQSTPGVSSRLFSSLAKAGVNIRAIAQGSSEHNISVVVYASEEQRALRAAHSAFYLSDHSISVGLIGPGLVGGTLLEQLREQAAQLQRDFGVEFRVRGIASSRRMLLGEPTIELAREGWRAQMDARGEPLELQRFAQHINDGSMPHAVIVDCTASGEIGAQYVDWLRDGISIVTPNKRANTASMAYYGALREAQRHRKTHFFYEANVGAGLPVISTIRDLQRTGDRFEQVEGIFSGTLSYIFNEFDGSTPFSEVVQRARQLGYTEPDPREDLAGMDVARKVVILGREMGLGVELSQIKVQSLVPRALSQESGVTVEQFMAQLPEHDEELGRMAREAKAAGEVLRYVGVVDVAGGECRVELRRYAAAHPFGALRGSDNIVSFRTARYDAQPLVVRGPGAGAEVTAAGVFADLLRLAAYLGAPSAEG